VPKLVPNWARCRVVGPENFWHLATSQFCSESRIPEKSATWVVVPDACRFGKAGALLRGMMPQLTETLESNPRPYCTREQARELLEGLRAAYQSLSLAERLLAKSFVSQMRRAQEQQETD